MKKMMKKKNSLKINRRKGTEPLEENRRKGTEPLEENRRKGRNPLKEVRRKGRNPLKKVRRKGTEPLEDLIKGLNNLDINDIPDINDNNVYELAIITSRLINNKIDELGKIEWTNGESNLDSGYSKLACNCCEEAWNEYILKYKEFRGIRIKCTIPDINIVFEYPNKKKIIEKKIELKSSKNSKMPGSTIRKLDVNQPLIYCLRSENPLKFETRCSLYHQAMGESDLELFQDRSPRPCINFEKMNKNGMEMDFEIKKKECWIDHYAKCAINRINHKKKYKSWQDHMIRKIKKNLLEEFIKTTSIDKFKEIKEEIIKS